jgi:mono/diheme cytochrome c family protein
MSAAQGLDRTPSRPVANRVLPVLFTLSALWLVGFWILWLSTYLLHRTYVSGDTAGTNASRLESWWMWLALAGIGWGGLNLYWSIDALRRAHLKSFLGHWLITAACGLIVIGIEAVLISRALTITPIIIDHSGTDSTEMILAFAQPTTPIAGNPENGKMVFSKTCITCHGPTGQGMPNLAPSLVGSAYIKSADDSAVATVIRQGRALGDPTNKSGKVMPARGGNPFLSEEEIAHLTAFVRAIQSAPASTSDGVPAVQLASWVVPSAKPSARGIDLRLADREMVGGLSRMEYTAGHRSQLFRWLTILLTSVHGLLLLGVVAISCNVVLPQMISRSDRINVHHIRLSIIGWILAATTWLLIAWLCFWWR